MDVASLARELGCHTQEWRSYLEPVIAAGR